MSTMRQRSTPSRSSTPERTPVRAEDDVKDDKNRASTVKLRRNGALFGLAEGTGRLVRIGACLYVVLVLGNRLGRLISYRRGGGFANPLRRGLRSQVTALALNDWSSKIVADTTIFESTEITRSEYTDPRCGDYGDAYYNPSAIGSDQAYEFLLSQAPEGATILEMGSQLRRSACFALQWMVKRKAYDVKMDVGIIQDPVRDKRKKLKEDQWTFGKRYKTAFDGFIGHLFDAGVLPRLNRVSHGPKVSEDLLTLYDDNSLFYVYTDMPSKQSEAKDRLCKWLDKVQVGGWIGGNNYRLDGVDGALLDVFTEEINTKIRFLGPYWLVKKEESQKLEGCGGPPRQHIAAQVQQPPPQEQKQDEIAAAAAAAAMAAVALPPPPKEVKPALGPAPKGPPSTIFFATHHKTGTALSRHVGKLLESKGLIQFSADNNDESNLMRKGSGEEMTCPGTPQKPEVRSYIHWPQWMIGDLWSKCIGEWWENWPEQPGMDKLETCIGAQEGTWLQKLRSATCGKNYKVIHFVRNPVDIMLSSYRYTKLGKEGWMHEKVEDHSKFKSEYCKSMSCKDLTIKEAVEKLPVTEGIELELNLVSIEIVKQMMVAHALAKLDPEHHITVNLSEIMESSKNFDNTWTKILKGVFPKKQDKAIKGMLKAVKQFDMNANPEAGAHHSTVGKTSKSESQLQEQTLYSNERVRAMVEDDVIKSLM